MPEPPQKLVLLGTAADACRENARYLCDSAKAIAKSGRFGAASALLAIALEELGKAIAFRLCVEGVAKIEGTGKGTRVIISLPWGKTTLKLADHEGKQGVPVWLEFFLGVLPALVGLLLSIGGRGPRGKSDDRGHTQPPGSDLPHDVEEHVPPTPEDIGELDRGYGQARAEGELLRRFTALKEAGLYVDCDGSYLKRPSDIDQQTYDLAAKVVRGYVDLVDRAFERGIVKGTIDGLVQSASDALSRVRDSVT